MEPSYIGAYWGSRRESALQCGERLADCILRLGEIDKVLGSWFRRGASKAAAKVPVVPDGKSLCQLLAKGVNRRDVDSEVVEELGFSVGLWNRASPTVGLSGTVGAYPSFQGVLNSFVLDFPPPEADALRLYEPSVAEAIFDAIIEIWEPEWATWTAPSLRNIQNAAPREPVIGWLTYLDTPDVADLPGATTRALLSGTVIKTQQDVNGVDEAVVLDTRARLAKNEALRPIP